MDCGSSMRAIGRDGWVRSSTRRALRAGDLVERFGYHIQAYRLTATGACAACGTVIPGRWDEAFAGQRIDRPMLWRRRA